MRNSAPAALAIDAARANAAPELRTTVIPDTDSPHRDVLAVVGTAWVIAQCTARVTDELAGAFADPHRTLRCLVARSDHEQVAVLTGDHAPECACGGNIRPDHHARIGITEIAYARKRCLRLFTQASPAQPGWAG